MAEELRVSKSSSKSARKLDLRTAKASIWRGAYLRPSELQSAEVTKTPDGVRILVRAKYTRPDAPDQFLAGEYALLISRRGDIAVSYDFEPVNASGTFLETGLSIVAPERASEFRWLGAGPFAGYPGKDQLNEFGSYHLNCRDLRFQGNRREVELAALASPAGPGLLLAGAPMDVAVENSAGVIVSHNAQVSGRGNKGSDPETSLKADSVKHIAGKFTLVPLGSIWPPLLTSWLGHAGDSATPFQPFYHSYDQ